MSGAVVIDGKGIAFTPGETILDVAQRAGREIPTLCHVDGLPPEGGCRMCMVEVGPDRACAAACHTAVTDGMEIRTDSQRLQTMRRETLRLMCEAHPDAALLAAPETPFARLLQRFGIEATSGQPRPAAIDDSHPYMRFDRRLCIDCRQCLNVCEDIQGRFVYGIEGRGGRSHLIIGSDDTFRNSPCVACGACVDECPTHAVTDRDRLGGEQAERVTRSICGLLRRRVRDQH